MNAQVQAHCLVVVNVNGDLLGIGGLLYLASYEDIWIFCLFTWEFKLFCWYAIIVTLVDLSHGV